MKLNRFESASHHPSSGDMPERLAAAPGERIRRVEASDGLENQRQRSLRQELAGQPEVPQEPAANDVVARQAHHLATQIIDLGPQADQLVQVSVIENSGLHTVDDSA